MTYIKQFVRLLCFSKHILAVVQCGIPRVQQKSKSDLPGWVSLQRFLETESIYTDK